MPHNDTPGRCRFMYAMSARTYLWDRKPKVLILQASYMVKFSTGRGRTLMNFKLINTSLLADKTFMFL